MAGNSVIGALRVVLGVDSAALEKGLKQANSSLNGFASGLKKLATGLGVALIFHEITSSIKGAIDEAAKLGRLAESVGVPVEQLSKLKLAADLSGVSIETLAKSLGILSKNMVSAAAGTSEMDVKGSKAAKAFAALGVAVRDEVTKNLLSSEEVMLQVAEKFAQMDNGATKTAFAMMIFGKAGKDMIPLLNKGRDGIQEMMTEAEKLGLVIGTKTSKAAIEFNNTLIRMEAIKKAVFIMLAEKLLPHLQQLANMMLEARTNSNLMTDAAEGVVLVVKKIVAETILGAAAITNFSEALRAMGIVAAAALEKWVTKPTFSMEGVNAAADEYKKIMTANEERSRVAAERAAAVWVDARAAFEQYDNVISNKKPLAPMIEATKAAKNALESYLISQAKKLAADQAEVATFGMLAGARESLKVQLEATAISTAKNIPITAALRAEIDATALAAGNMALKLAGLKLTEEVLTPWEKYNQTLAKNNELMAAGEISAETLKRANQQAADASGLSWRMASESIAGSFTELAGAVGDANSDIAKGAKIFAAAVAFINILVAQSYALAQPFPFNLAAMAMVAAKGAVLIAAIRSAVVPSKKAAHGADWMVGGAGGVDNNLVAFQASRGERVTVETPGQMGRGDGQVGLVNLTLNGIGASRAELREMVEQLNGMFADGYRLQVVGAR